MSVAFRTLVQRGLGLSARSFRDLVAQQHGAHDDLDTAWVGFEPVAATLVETFYTTLDDPRPEVLVPKLDAVDVHLRGIAYEGVGMGLTLLDSLFPWRRRLVAFLDGPGANYRILALIGAGLVLPRVPGDLDRFTARHDPLLHWFVLDGYGFYDGFFHWRRSIGGQAVPDRIQGYGRRVYDQGLGRSFWFSTGADVDRITATIGDFPATRQPDLWSGIGLACAYAAGVADAPTIRRLLRSAGAHAADLATGSALAAAVRAQTGHPAAHTELACGVVWGRDSHDVAATADRARRDLPADGAQPAYEIWRRRIREAWVPAAIGTTDDGVAR